MRNFYICFVTNYFLYMTNPYSPGNFIAYDKRYTYELMHLHYATVHYTNFDAEKGESTIDTPS